ncbi:MAG: hypothetical protein IPQ07_44665 [Myxococcales bacterium]|nr:hypothetical protein [Myxococcales bacterium]
MTIATAPGTCTFQTAKGGQYAVTATIIDDKGRQNQSKLQFTVSGGEATRARGQRGARAADP